MKGWIGHYFGLYTEVLPGPPKYLPHQCPHRARLVPEIVPEIVPDPPLHSAQVILAFRKKDFYVFFIGMYLGTMKGWIGHYFGFYFGHYFGLYSGFTKVLPGPRRYLPYRCLQRLDPMSKIVKSLTLRSREQLKSFLNSRSFARQVKFASMVHGSPPSPPCQCS